MSFTAHALRAGAGDLGMQSSIATTRADLFCVNFALIAPTDSCVVDTFDVLRGHLSTL